MFDGLWFCLLTVPTVGGAVFAGAVWALRRTFATRESMEQMGTRVALLEEVVKHQPTDRDIQELRLALSRYQGDLKQTTARLDAVSHQLRLLVDHAINGSK